MLRSIRLEVSEPAKFPLPKKVLIGLVSVIVLGTLAILALMATAKPKVYDSPTRDNIVASMQTGFAAKTSTGEVVTYCPSGRNNFRAYAGHGACPSIDKPSPNDFHVTELFDSAKEGGTAVGDAGATVAVPFP